MKKKNLTGTVFGIALAFAMIGSMLTGLASIGSYAAADELATFPDPNLEAAIRDAVGKPTGDIYQSDLVGLTFLNAEGRNIVNLGGLEHCTGLTVLWLDDNQISDISPLSGLTDLYELYLNRSQISDISPLSGLTDIQHLNLGSNQITDIRPVSGLTNLVYLALDSNRIGDISALSGLTNLEDLNLAANEIGNISPLSGFTNIRHLYLESNQIDDISRLSNLTNLRYLNLDINQISDVSPLSGLSKLRFLCLDSNEISDISPLSGLTSLRHLYLESNQISDISKLANLTGLVALYLDHNQVVDISSISGLTQLGEDTWFQEREGIPICLGLRGNQVADISWVVANPGLADGDGIDLRGNSLSDESFNIYIPQLEGRGATVLYDAPPPSIAWNFPSTSDVFLGPTPNNGRPYLDAAVSLPTGTEPPDLSGVYWLDEATGDWKYFIPGFTLSTLSSLEPGQSYLTAVSGPCSWNLPCGEGTPLPTGNTWNFPSTSDIFIGPNPDNGRPYLDAAVSLPTGTEPQELSAVYWLDEATGDWQYFDPESMVSTLASLEPDEAYIVAVSGPCNWNLP